MGKVNKDSVIRFRISNEEKELLEKASEAESMKTSAFIRDVAIKKAKSVLKKK